MIAGAIAEVALVDAVIDDVPVVGTWDVDDRVMARAVDLVAGILDDDDGVLCHFDGTLWRRAGAIGHVVVLGTGIVDTPQEIVEAVAIEHIGALTVGVGLQRAARGGDVVLFGIDTHHIVGHQAIVHTTITII